MSRLTEAYRTIKVYNAYGFAQHGNVYIVYEPYCSVARRGGHWAVYRPGFKTDPTGHWLDGGNKTFSTFGVDRQLALEEAQKWARAKYGIKTWARTPFRSYMDADFVKRRKVELAELLKAEKR